MTRPQGGVFPFCSPIMDSCLGASALRRFRSERSRCESRIGTLRFSAAWPREVNTVWNACNAHQREVFRREGRFLSGFDFAPFVVGASAEFELIGSSTIDEIRDQYATKRRAAGKPRLSWRSSGGKRRSLGWVPFKSRATHWTGDAVRFAGLHFHVWDSYGLGGYAFRSVHSSRTLVVVGTSAFRSQSR